MKAHCKFIVSSAFLFVSAFSFGQTDPDSLPKPPDTTNVNPAAPAVVAPAATPEPAKSGRRDTRPWNERIALGFGTGFWITPSTTYVELAPILAYRFPKRITTGVGYRYIYRHERVIDRDLSSYGPNVFGRMNLTKRIYFWTEYEILKTEYLINDEASAVRESDNIDSWFAGLGYMRSMGRKGRGGISIQVLYNMLYKDDGINPYYFPVTYRVGYFF